MGSPALRVRRLSIYLGWTLLLMPVQAFGLALQRSWTATPAALLSPLVLPHSRPAGAPHRAPDAGPPGAVRRQPHLLSRHPGARLADRRSRSSPRREVARWPLFGWLARLQRSVFIDRQVRSTARAARRDRRPARRQGGAHPLSRGNQRRRQPRAAVQERAVQRRRSRRERPRDGAAGLGRLYQARRHADRPPLAPAFRLVRRDGDGAASVDDARARHRRGRRRVPPADDVGRIRLAQGAGALLRGARRRRARAGAERPPPVAAPPPERSRHRRPGR